MQVDKVFYFLQPGSVQAISLLRMLKQGNSCRIIAVLLENEKLSKAIQNLYSDVITVKSYADLSSALTLVPFGAASTEALLKKRDIVLSDVVMQQAALSVYDKELFIAFCQAHNLPVPQTYFTVDQFGLNDFPVFYKQKYEAGGGLRGIAYSKADLPKAEQDSLIYQEFIDTQGTYGVGFIAKEGVLEVHFSHFESLSYPVSGGSAIKIEAYTSARLIELTEQYIAASNYSGWGLAEFKWCEKRQDFVFMEINAKFWASCEFSFRNEPAFIKQLFAIQTEQETIDSMVFINRAFNAGFMTGLKCLFAKPRIRKVFYPGLLRAVIYGLLSDSARVKIKKMLAK